MQAPYGSELRKWTEHRAGVTLGLGIGMAEPDDQRGMGIFGSAHGARQCHMTLGMLGVLDAGFKALKVAHGDGALEAAGRILSEVKPGLFNEKLATFTHGEIALIIIGYFSIKEASRFRCGLRSVLSRFETSRCHLSKNLSCGLGVLLVVLLEEVFGIRRVRLRER